MMTSDPFSLSFNQATTHYFNKDFKEAIGSLNTCLELHPTDAGSFYLRAECNYRLKNYNQSEEDIQKAIVRDPKCASAFFLRGNLFHERYKDFSKAIEDYSLAIQLNSEVFSYYLNRATCYFRVRMFEEAVEDLDRSIALQSSDRALAQRGKVRAAAKQYEKAIVDYSEAILANKSHTMYYNNRAECYFHLGRHEEAMRDLERAHELCPNSVTALHLKGMIFHAKKNYLEAIDCYSKAITDKGTNPIFYFNRGESYRKLKMYSECLEDYSTAIKLDSHDVDNYNNRGNVYFAMGKYQQAIDDYSSCIGIQSSFSIFYFNRGNCYFQMKKYREAVSDFGKAIELNPNYIKAYNKRGLALTFLKDFQLALIDYSNVIQNYKGENVSYLYNRGNCYYELGMFSEALQDLDRVLIQNDKYDLAYNRRGIVFYRMKNYKDAISNFTKAIDLCTTNPIYFCNRGDSYYYSKNYPEAISDFNLAILKLTDPNVLSDCYYKLGRTFYARKEHSLAIKNYSKALTFQSDNPYYLFHQGNAYIKLRDRTKAMAAYDEAIRLDPNFADAIFKRGNVYYSQKLYEKSALEYSRCISIQSNNATYFYSRGNCYRVLERYQEALQDLETAINLNKKCYQAFNIRGLVFMLKHEYKHAMSDFLQLENKNFQYKKEFAQLLKNNVSEITQQGTGRYQ
jgi:tetratricopeptide (TPR) repeat protein